MAPVLQTARQVTEGASPLDRLKQPAGRTAKNFNVFKLFGRCTGWPVRLVLFHSGRPVHAAGTFSRSNGCSVTTVLQARSFQSQSLHLAPSRSSDVPNLTPMQFRYHFGPTGSVLAEQSKLIPVAHEKCIIGFSQQCSYHMTADAFGSTARATFICSIIAISPHLGSPGYEIVCPFF